MDKVCVCVYVEGLRLSHIYQIQEQSDSTLNTSLKVRFT